MYKTTSIFKNRFWIALCCPEWFLLSSQKTISCLPDPKIIVSLHRKSYCYEIPYRHTDIREHH